MSRICPACGATIHNERCDNLLCRNAAVSPEPSSAKVGPKSSEKYQTSPKPISKPIVLGSFVIGLLCGLAISAFTVDLSNNGQVVTGLVIALIGGVIGALLGLVIAVARTVSWQSALDSKKPPSKSAYLVVLVGSGAFLFYQAFLFANMKPGGNAGYLIGGMIGVVVGAACGLWSIHRRRSRAQQSLSSRRFTDFR